MGIETYSFSNDLQLALEDIVKKLRALDSTIDVQEKETPAGKLIEAKSSDANLPVAQLILNQINNQLILRLEIIGNITQYIVDQILNYLHKNFNLVYLEVTDPKTGLIKFSLSKKGKDVNIHEIYKRELFKFHYPRDDGRLLLFYDQGSLWIHPEIKPIVTEKPKPALKSPIIKPAIKPIQIVKPSQPHKEQVVEVKQQIEPIKVPKETIKPIQVVTPQTEEIIQPLSEIQKKPSKIRQELSQRELMILKLVESKPNKKVQSKGLRKELPSLDQDTIRNVLRSLVAKGLLYVRSAWYIVKEDPSEDTWDIASETPIEERLKSLSPKERKIYDILDTRPGAKAQARMLIKETKMTKDNLKKLLRNMVAKDVLYVYAAWYCIKE